MAALFRELVALHEGHTYWFRERRFFDYSKEEETEVLRVPDAPEEKHTRKHRSLAREESY